MSAAGLLLILIIGFVATAVFIWRQSKTKGRWGIGAIGGKQCPRCGTRLPMIRKPASAEEMMWGGWTCRTCGCKVDKYGRERATVSPS
jgi:hypothetical protein